VSTLWVAVKACLVALQAEKETRSLTSQREATRANKANAFARIYSLRFQSERFHANRAFQSVGEAIRCEHPTRDLTSTQSHGSTMPSYYDIDAILTDAQVSEI